ncbi:MAG: Gfo/Idh/MocA family protein [Spirochaetales bacterium]
MGDIKTIVVGAGGISNAWFPNLVASGAEIIGIVDLDPARAKAAIEKHGLVAETPTFSSLPEALDAERPDLVCDLTPPAFHFETARTALSAGCHVYSEKPMCDDLTKAAELNALAARMDKTYAIMQNRRFRPEIVRFKQSIERGDIGTLTTLNADFYLGPHFGGFREEMEHVLLFDMAIHTFDMARFISGADPQAVYCHEWNPAGSWYSHGASAVAIFEMSGGVVFTYRGSWCAEGQSTSWESEWHAVGTTGSARWDGGAGLAAERLVAGAEGFARTVEAVELPAPEVWEKSGHAAAIDDFLNCLREGRQPQTHGGDNVRSLAMTLEAIRSAEQGKRIEITL